VASAQPAESDQAPRGPNGRGGGAPHLAEKVTFVRPAALGGLDVMTVENSERLWRIYHETYAVCAVSGANRGVAEWRYRRRDHQASAGSLMLMEPGELHVTTRISAPGTFTVLLLPLAFLHDVASQVGYPSSSVHFKVAEARDGQLFRSAATLIRSLRLGRPELDQQVVLWSCLHRLLEKCAERAPHAAPLLAPGVAERVREVIEDCYASKLQLADLASVAEVSPFHLCRVFTAHFGLPPHAYLARVRVARARRLLGQGWSAADVAVAVGFSDQSHLTRWFQTVMGTTPGRYAAGGTTARTCNTRFT
jgi:AraC-like DNA-binding protein